MSERDILDAAKAMIQTVIPGFVVIYNKDPEPTAPRPTVDDDIITYAAIEIQSDTAQWATVGERTTDTVSGDLVEQVRAVPVDGLLAIEIYGPDAGDSARALRLSHGRTDVLAAVGALGDYTIENPSGVTNDPVLRSATREDQTSITFDIRWIDSEIYDLEGVDEITTTVAVT